MPAAKQQSVDSLEKLSEKIAKKKEVAAPADEPKKAKLDSLGRSYATGRRKNSSARVWIKSGTGKMIVNGREIAKYFARPVYLMLINQPFEATSSKGHFDIFSTVKGGGLSGQAGAIRHGISKALDNFDPNFHKVLRQGGFLTRDSRAVERKKYGKKKARRSFQFSKR